MKAAAITLMALVEIGTGSPTGVRVSQRQLVDAPKSYVGRKIVLSGIGCVDDAKSGFLCVAIVGGQALRVEAGALGAKTKLEIAERLIGDCKGTANLTRSACRVDAEIEPANAYKDVMETSSGTMPIVVVYSPQIEMYEPRRR